jgi:hypothetical protein
MIEYVIVETKYMPLAKKFLRSRTGIKPVFILGLKFHVLEIHTEVAEKGNLKYTITLGFDRPKEEDKKGNKKKGKN